MNNKVLFFSLGLVFLSLVLGYILGVLDFFGFLTGQHTLNFVYLGLAFLCWHLTGLMLFIVNLDDTHHESTYLAASIAFGVIFFVFNQHYLAALLATCSYFVFQLVISKMLSDREAKFVRFSTKEIIFPVIRKSFLFLLAIFVIVGYFQSQAQTSKKGIVTPYMIKSIMKPFIPLANRQLSAQLRTQLGNSFGLNLENLPYYDQVVQKSEDVDVSPAVNSMAPEIADSINHRLTFYLPFVPLIFALIVFLLVSPLIAVSEIFFLPVVRALVSLLISLKIITVTEEEVKREVLRI